MSWRQDWWFRWMLGLYELLDLMAVFRDHYLFRSLFWFQGQTNQYRGFIDCAQTIMREEGAGAFLKVKLLHRNRRSNKNLHIDDQKQQAFTSRHISNSVWYHIRSIFACLCLLLLSFWLQGIEPRVLCIGIGGSIFFAVLEKTKSVLAERNTRRWEDERKLLASWSFPYGTRRKCAWPDFGAPVSHSILFRLSYVDGDSCCVIFPRLFYSSLFSLKIN